MRMPKVSVIVPVYKCEVTLKASVNTLIKQSLSDIEIILVDDGSPDKSGSICDELAKEDNRIKVIHKVNGGAGSARNSGIKVATGEYIGFMDSDDFVDLDMYKIMYETAIDNNLDLVRCNTIITQNGKDKLCWSPSFCGEILQRNTIRSKVIPMMIAPEVEGNFNERLLKGCVCCIFRKQLLEEFEITFSSLKSGEDALFTIEAMWNSSSIMLIDCPFYRYIKQESDSLSISLDRLQNYTARNESKEMLKHIIGNTEFLPIFEDRWKQAERRYIYLDVRIATIYNPTATRKEKIALLRKILNSKECDLAFSDKIQGKLPVQMNILYSLIRKKKALSLYCLVMLKHRFLKN